METSLNPSVVNFINEYCNVLTTFGKNRSILVDLEHCHGKVGFHTGISCYWYDMILNFNTFFYTAYFRFPRTSEDTRKMVMI